MNRNEKKILKLFKHVEANDFLSESDIVAKMTKISPEATVAECNKLRKAGYLEQGNKNGEQNQYQITIEGQDALDDAKMTHKSWNLSIAGTISALIISVSAIIIHFFK